MVAATPNLDGHAFWSERATGLRCEATHRVIDSWASILGAHHRIYFHDPISVAIVANQVEGPQCIPAAENHILVDQAYGDPSTKIMMEMVRLTETSPVEGEAPPRTYYNGSRYGRCRVRH
jgi:hypothetical protein